MGDGEDQSQRIEAVFREQYAGLSDAELRDIAADEQPYREDGHYVHAARRAARQLLIERGAEDVPSVPIWDPSATHLPRSLRWGAVAAVLLVAVGAVIAYGLSIAWEPTQEEACGRVDALLHPAAFRQRYLLTVEGCSLDRAASTERADATVVPIRARACITLDAKRLERLSRERPPLEMAWVRQFASRPVPGRHCAPDGFVIGEAVVRHGHPWYVRLTSPGG